jgi:hypothetical protein
MNDNILKDFPDSAELLEWYKKNSSGSIHEVNGHLHTPYSFSAFRDMAQIFEMAQKENLKVLGINDFYVMDGYGEFYSHCLRNGIFPLFNIEFIGLLKHEQDLGIRINDPNNPGRTYFSGKGLRFPPSANPSVDCILQNLKYESQVQVKEMIDKVNIILSGADPSLSLKYSEVKRLYAKELVRERHIARAIRELIFSRYPTETERLSMLEQIYDGKKCRAALSDPAALENEIRGNLLKAGGRAFVPEDENAFLPAPEIINIILASGGIPCYPVLLDNPDGVCTEYEADKQLLMNELISMNVHCIELIPGRNDLGFLRDFVMFFDLNGFVITFGTEHNAPGLMPLTVTGRGAQPLDEDLKKISFRGACVIAAHQYLHARGEEGYILPDGAARKEARKEFVSLGKAVIEKYIRTQHNG